MNPDRWSEVEKLYLAALEYEPPERAAFLDQYSDEEVRKEVLSLLEHEQNAERLLEDSPLRPSVLKQAINLDSGPPLVSGTRLGPYEIVSRIGAGGMGEVYRARDSRLSREVAPKVLLAAFATDSDRRRRFEQEGRAVASLNHPNIVVLHDVGSDDGVYYVVTELLDGDTLRQRLAKGARPVQKAIEYAIQIARGLAAAHAKGITHRDLKPENLFITKAGVIKILDFGLAKQNKRPAGQPPKDLSTELIETELGKVMGTSGYMSPEQVLGEVVDARSDLFGFGIVLYEVVSGKQAFTGDSAVQVMNAIVHEEPHVLGATVPAALERVIRRCLEKKPEERFQSALDLAFALESVLATAELLEPRRPDVQLRRRYLVGVAIAAGVAVLVGGGAIAGRLTTRSPFLSFQRVTFRRGIIPSARFANDGKTIVYSAAWDGNSPHVYSTQTENPESRDLGFENATLFAVSPTQEMALALPPDKTSNSVTLARAPISGGAARRVAENVYGADWSPDGAALAIVRLSNGFSHLEYPIGRVLYETTDSLLNPRISPKGDLIALIDQPIAEGAAYLAVVDMKGNKKMLSRLWFGGLQGLAWNGDGEILICAGVSGVTRSLWGFDRRGRERLISNLPGNFGLLDVTTDHRILLQHFLFSGSIFTHRPGATRETDLYWHDTSWAADISRDGRTLLFGELGDATRLGEDVVTYLRGTDGSPATRLGRGMPLEISPDGKWAVALGSEGRPSQLILLPTGTGEARALTHDAIHHKGAAWTPDGQHVVFVGDEPGHGDRYYLQSLDGAPPRTITPNDVAFGGSFEPVVISSDGRFIALTTLAGKVTVQPLNGGAAREVPGVSEGLTPLRWCPDGRTLLVYNTEALPPLQVNIFQLDIETGMQRAWKEWAPSNKTGVMGLVNVRVDAECRNTLYSIQYGLSDLWVASGLR